MAPYSYPKSVYITPTGSPIMAQGNDETTQKRAGIDIQVEPIAPDHQPHGGILYSLPEPRIAIGRKTGRLVGNERCNTGVRPRRLDVRAADAPGWSPYNY